MIKNKSQLFLGTKRKQNFSFDLIFIFHYSRQYLKKSTLMEKVQDFDLENKK